MREPQLDFDAAYTMHVQMNVADKGGVLHRVAAIQDSGLEPVEWVDETVWTLDWFQGLGVRLASAGTAATLPGLLTDGPTRAGALSDGILTVHRGAFALAPAGLA